MTDIPIEVLLIADGTLFLVLSFFLRRLLNRFDRSHDQLNSVDKAIALIVQELEHRKEIVRDYELFKDKTDADIIGIKESINRVISWQNGHALIHTKRRKDEA